jgi:hypothetical protein
MNQVTNTTGQPGIFRRSGVRYEVACDCIGALIAHFASVVGIERSSAAPDADKIDRSERLTADLRDIRETLDPADESQIQATIERLAPLARLLYLDLQEGTQEARRAAEFEQANHSLTLAGMPPGINDLAIQAQIVLGTLTHDQSARSEAEPLHDQRFRLIPGSSPRRGVDA